MRFLGVYRTLARRDSWTRCRVTWDAQRVVDWFWVWPDPFK